MIVSYRIVGVDCRAECVWLTRRDLKRIKDDNDQAVIKTD